jgi:hypothetical protein
MVESVVDFYGIKVTGVVGKPVLLREAPEIEDPPPVVIEVARGSDPKLASSRTHASVSLTYPEHRKRVAFYRLLALLPLTRATLNMRAHIIKRGRPLKEKDGAKSMPATPGGIAEPYRPQTRTMSSHRALAYGIRIALFCNRIS